MRTRRDRITWNIVVCWWMAGLRGSLDLEAEGNLETEGNSVHEHSRVHPLSCSKTDRFVILVKTQRPGIPKIVQNFDS